MLFMIYAKIHRKKKIIFLWEQCKMQVKQSIHKFTISTTTKHSVLCIKLLLGALVEYGGQINFQCNLFVSMSICYICLISIRMVNKIHKNKVKKNI